MPKVRKLGEILPSSCAVLNTIRTEYSHWNWFNEKGYIKYFSPDYKSQIFEHRLVAAKAYGVELNPRTHVHHKNDQKSDNRADNLELLSITEHASLHHRKKIESTCDYCGEKILRSPQDFHRNKHHYCNEKCTRLARGILTKPTSQELQQLIVEINNFCELGRMFNVCDNTIRNWANEYGILPSKRKKGRLAGHDPVTS